MAFRTKPTVTLTQNVGLEELKALLLQEINAGRSACGKLTTDQIRLDPIMESEGEDGLGGCSREVLVGIKIFCGDVPQ